MAKYNVLVVTPKIKTGVEYHRQLVPHAYLRSYEEFEIATINEIESESFQHNGETVLMEDFLKQFQLVHFSRTISYGWDMDKTVKKLNKLGIACVLDIDDYWHYGKTHVLYNQHIVDEVPKKTTRSLTLADHVTTTTPYFADVIKAHNKNVTVLENAINPDEPQFKPEPTESEWLRFGWMGSQCHVMDVAMLSKPLHELNKLNLNYKIVYGGYVNSEVGRFFNMCLSSNGNIPKEKYETIGWKDCFNYATVYNDIDVVVAPLVGNKFNQCKSEIKLIEAGFMKKGAIASSVMPYTLLGNDKNSLMVKPDAWLQALKAYINNPNMVKDHAGQLHEDVKDKYHIATVTKKRVDLYKRLIEEKNK